jgi:hypothetical protein
MTLRGAAVVAIVAVLFAVAIGLQSVRESRYPPAPDDDVSLYLQSGNTVRRLAGAYTPLAADLYWIRAIQYYGGTKRRMTPAQGPGLDAAAPPPGADDKYSQLFTLLDITTTLDPRFNIAYRFGATFLAEAYPNGPGRPDLAVALLEKGLRERPDNWEYMQDIAFVHYWYRHDYLAASDWFEKAGDVPGAPWWLRSMAATTRAKGGDRASSRIMWEAIRQTTEIEWLRKDAERKLAQLRALDDIDALQRVVDAVTARDGAPPADWTALVRARALRGIPLDPAGTPYTLKSDGRVMLSESSPLWPLLVEPPAQSSGGAVSGAGPTPIGHQPDTRQARDGRQPR